MGSETVTTKEAARILGVSTPTVIRLVNSRRLRAYKLTGLKNSPFRIDAESVRALLREREAGPTEGDAA